MTDEEWNQQFARCLCVSLSGEAVDEIDERGQRVRDENFLLLMNAYHDELPFVLPAPASDAGWLALVDTSCQTTRHPDAFYSGGSPYPLQPRSLALLVERTASRVRGGADRRYTPAE